MKITADKKINSDYQRVIEMSRLLKSHATNALLLPGDLVILEPIIPTVRSYFIPYKPIPKEFVYLYLNLSTISKVNSKFKKTMSILEWIAKDDTSYMQIRNPEQDPYDIYIIDHKETIKDMISELYSRVPPFDTPMIEKLVDEPDELYTRCDGLAGELADKKLCTVIANNYPMIISKPFLGDTKKTNAIMYRVIQEDFGPTGKIYVKFKQKEAIGNIYTYAAFMKLPNVFNVVTT